MSNTYGKLFEPVALAATAATIYTVPLTPTSVLLRGARIRLTNTTAAAVAASVNTVPAGAAIGPSNSILTARSVSANDYMDIDVPTLKAGDFINAFGLGLTIHFVTGVLFS